MRREWLLAVWLIAFLFLGAFINAALSANQPSAAIEQPQTNTQNHQIHRSDEKWEAIWERTFDDPVALYTFVLAIFTAVLSFAAIVQIGFLIRADKTAAASANASVIAAEAAKKSAEVIPKLERAWVRLKPDRGAPSLAATMIAKATIVNSGKSPAFELCSANQVVLGGANPVFAPWPATGAGVTLTVFPGSTDHKVSREIALTPTDIARIRAGTILYWAGRIYYKDAFGNDRTSDWQYRWRPARVAGDSDSWAYCAEGNDAT